MEDSSPPPSPAGPRAGLRILHAIATVNPAAGGPIEGVKQIGRINAALGHTHEVVCFDDPASPWIETLGLKVHAMGPGRSFYDYNKRFVKWLRENRMNHDVVIVNGIWGYNALGTWLALKGTDTPYFVYTHGMLDPWFKRRYPLKHLKKWLFWPWAVYPVLRDARGVMFTCEEERRLARQSFWLYRCNEIVVRYGTPGVSDPARDYAAEFLDKFPQLKSFRRFVFLGRVHPKKGPDIILEAIARLQREGLWDRATMRFVMAGPADGAYAEELRALAAKLGVEGSVVWTGMLTGDDKWGALQASEAFVLPSHQENFGIAVAEALSTGVPVLISRSVNIWADITADGAGLADDDTVEGCVRVWTEWLKLPENAKQEMSDKARKCFESRYTSRAAAASLVENICQPPSSR